MQRSTRKGPWGTQITPSGRTNSWPALRGRATPGPAAKQELLDTAAGFFALQLEERLALDNRTFAQFHGYTRLGAEITRGRADSREQIDFGPDRDPVSAVPADRVYWRRQGTQPVAGLLH